MAGAYDCRVAARLIALSLAVVIGGFGLIARHDTQQCLDSSSAFFRVGYKQQKALTATQTDAVIAACRGSHILAVGANFLAQRHQPREAIRLSDEAIRREPRNFEGWIALSRAL